MALPEHDAAVGHSFGLDVDGVLIEQILDVSGVTMGQNGIELKHSTANGKYVIGKLPAQPKAGEFTMIRRIIPDSSFEQWVKAARFDAKTDAGKDGTITAFDRQGNPVKRVKLTNTRPTSVEISSVRSGDTTVLVEKLVLTYERLEFE